ncbi:MAG: Rne/Rng family ribonuclease, partial [Holosporales bacterium]|nr:Rne/Rng family ribonuclease [Holosporales bacterium]
LTPNPPKGKGNAVSKKIDAVEKERLRGIVESLDIPEGMGCIVRTAGVNRTKQEIKRDLEYLRRLWGGLQEKTMASVAPDLIYEEGNIIKRSIRDLYQRTMDAIIIQGKAAYKEAYAFMKIFTPSHAKKIKLYDEESPLFSKYEIEEKIEHILEPTAPLPSGGSIVINATEALTAIDVNSGRSKNERNIEDTALKTNLEAATEIARQIRLRDISGIIIIDFIDMTNRQSNAKVEKKMRDAVKDDYANIQLSKISQFGLMELSRQRLRMSLTESNFVQCKHCDGSGKILSNDTTAYSVIRKIENALAGQNAKSVIAEVAVGVDLFILNHRRKLLNEIETKYGTFIEIVRNRSLSSNECKVSAREYKQNEPPEIKQPEIRQAAKSKRKKNIAKKVENSDSDNKLINKTNIKFQMKKSIPEPNINKPNVKEKPAVRTARTAQKRKKAQA